MRVWLTCIGALLGAANACARPVPDIVCSFAPSQSKAVASLASAAGGSAAALTAVAQATGLAVVTHSSGAAILTGSGGYIAGTLGAAAAGTFIVSVGLVAGTAALGVELICAQANHPDQVAKVEVAAKEFWRRSSRWIKDSKTKVGTQVVIARQAAKVIALDAVDYAYGRIPRSKLTPLPEPKE